MTSNHSARPAIELDPDTGRKRFNTRARHTSPDLSGVGYSVVTDEDLKTLPPLPAGAVFNAEEQARYREYKNQRAGTGDYIVLEGEFSKYLEDVYAPDPVPRETLHDECEILVVGAGFAGLILTQKLREAGFDDIRVCERGGDVGGTWYWNRYPGIACDVEAYSYLPLLDETGYIPTMKFASGLEIMEHCQRVAEKFGIYERCLFHTAVEKARWSETDKRWLVHTDRGDVMRARYLVLANGILTSPKLARIDGMDSFKGDWFHTSRWNYDVELKGKRVGVIGTGATAVQVVPELAKIVDELYVFQRTPSTIDIRAQRQTTDEEIAAWRNEPGWARARRARYAGITDVRNAANSDEDYLSGKVSDFKVRKQHATVLTPEERIELMLDKNFGVMEQIRARIDAVVHDPVTANILKPYYSYGCKRPTFHDEYLPAFNLPNVHLVDTAPLGVTKISERGVVHGDTEIPLDVLVYATGFQYMASSTFKMVEDVHGRSLNSKWEEEGTKTFLGIHHCGYPNLFVISGPQGGGGSFNFTNVIEDHVDHIIWMLETLRENGHSVVDVKQEAEDSYAQHCREADTATRRLRDCASYYNRYGQAEPGGLAYYGGVAAWHDRKKAAQESLDTFEFS